MTYYASRTSVLLCLAVLFGAVALAQLPPRSRGGGEPDQKPLGRHVIYSHLFQHAAEPEAMYDPSVDSGSPKM